MVRVNIEEIEQALATYLQKVEAGETVIILRDGHAVAEVKSVAHSGVLRPYGLCAGAFTTPDDFDAPLPETVLKTFEDA